MPFRYKVLHFLGIFSTLMVVLAIIAGIPFGIGYGIGLVGQYIVGKSLSILGISVEYWCGLGSLLAGFVIR